MKQVTFSPTQPRCAEAHLSPGCVLTSLVPSTYQTEVCLGRSLASALLGNPFDQPECVALAKIFVAY